MTAPDQFPNNRAHVINDPYAVILCFGNTAIVASIPATLPTVADGVGAKSATTKYGKAADRINAELDRTGRMTPYRALEITREMDDRPHDLGCHP